MTSSRSFVQGRGRLRGFRFKDWTDFVGEAEPCAGVVDGVNTLFQLQKTYNDGITTFIRKITRPVYANSGTDTTNTVVIYVNGVALLQTNDWNTQDAGVVKLHVAPRCGRRRYCGLSSSTYLYGSTTIRLL